MCEICDLGHPSRFVDDGLLGELQDQARLIEAEDRDEKQSWRAGPHLIEVYPAFRETPHPTDPWGETTKHEQTGWIAECLCGHDKRRFQVSSQRTAMTYRCRFDRRPRRQN